MTPMMPRRSPRRRRALAAVACLLWLLGVEVLPNLHLATHDDATPHVHTPGGMIVTVSFGATAHRHADGSVHAHAEPDGDLAEHAEPTADDDEKREERDERDEREAQLAFDTPPDLHVAAGLAHRALALHDPPPPELEPVAPTRHVTLAIALVEDHPGYATPRTASARGPPRA